MKQVRPLQSACSPEVRLLNNEFKLKPGPPLTVAWVRRLQPAVAPIPFDGPTDLGMWTTRAQELEGSGTPTTPRRSDHANCVQEQMENSSGVTSGAVRNHPIW